MPNRNGIGAIVAPTVAFLVMLLFVGYRARTFHYCAGTGDRPEARIVSGSQSCGRDEEPLKWRRLGWFGRMKLAANTAAKAFSAN
jgi:hypothetical protein